MQKATTILSKEPPQTRKTNPRNNNNPSECSKNLKKSTTIRNIYIEIASKISRYKVQLSSLSCIHCTNFHHFLFTALCNNLPFFILLQFFITFFAQIFHKTISFFCSKKLFIKKKGFTRGQ